MDKYLHKDTTSSHAHHSMMTMRACFLYSGIPV